MGNDNVVVIAAPRGSGKTVLVSDLLWHKRHIPAGIAMNATESSNRQYSHYLPKGFVYDSFDPEALENVIKHQKEMLRRLEKRGKTKEDLPAVFIIIDDCVFDPRFRKDPNLGYLFTNGRHIRCLIIVVTQYINYLTPPMRANIDMVFLLRDNNTNAIKLYHQYFGGVFPKPAQFREVFHALTQDYCCMAIDLRSKSTRVEDTVFWYQATLRPPFRTGADAFWQINRQLYNAGHEDKPKDTAPVHRIGYKPAAGGR